MHSPSWLDEVALDPLGVSVAMGTRTLGDRPWLVADEHEPEQLAMKQQLSRTRHAEVFATEPGTEDAAGDVVRLIEREGRRVLTRPDLHPLERAGLSVQEDLCLLRRAPEGWGLAAASLCFPSRWRLADKMGRDITTVHAPVDGYARALADRVATLFDRLGDRIVLRRNWFVHPDPALFQPDRPLDGDPLVAAPHVHDDLHLRSERQTIRALGTPGWALFTIRVQQVPLGELISRRGDELERWLREAPSREVAHRGMSPQQADAILVAMGGPARLREP